MEFRQGIWKLCSLLFLFLANISDGKGQLLTDSLIASYSLADIDSIYTANALPPFVGAMLIANNWR